MRPAENVRVWRKAARAAIKNTRRGRRSTHLVRTVVGRRRRLEERIRQAMQDAAEQIDTTSGLEQIEVRTRETSAVAPAEATHHSKTEH